MKRLTLRYNPKTRYRNGHPRYGSVAWCKKVVANENLTTWDYMRFAEDLRRTGNLKGLIMMQKLLAIKYEKAKKMDSADVLPTRLPVSILDSRRTCD